MQPLKDQLYSRHEIKRMAQAVAQAKTDFDEAAFTRRVHARGWKGLELKQRMRRVTTALHEALQLPYPEAADVMGRAASLGQGFVFISCSDYIEVYGQDDLDVSIPALRETTKGCSAEFAVRPFIAAHPDVMFKTMQRWAKDQDERIRRLASEGSRPRLPWGIADELRERIRALHAEQVAPVLDTLSRTRIELDAKALGAKSGAANRLVEVEVLLSALHDREVVYLQLRAPELASEEGLRAAVESVEEDAIGACLGLELTPLSALSDVPEVLTEKWLARIDDTNDMQRLSVREEQLTRAIERELPALKERVPSDYFLLLVVQGKTRLRDPVDVFLWDLARDKLVLRSRTENRGRLISVRSQIGPQVDSAKAAGDPIAIADCSIAAHIKAQLGEPTMDLATPD